MKKTRNLTQTVYSAVLDLMLSGRLLPGQKLQFLDLAQKFKVSRTPVNIALSMLAKDGFLRFTPNCGYVVNRLDRQEVVSLLAMKETLEQGFLPRAVTDVSEIDLFVVKGHMIECERAIAEKNDVRTLLADLDFHFALLAPTGNLVLLESYRRLCHLLLVGYRLELLSFVDAARMVREHRLIFAALSDRDAETFEQALATHWFLHGEECRQVATRSGKGRSFSSEGQHLVTTALPQSVAVFQ